MIKVILKGGLGNQMFQYAAAKSLALKNNTDLYLDTTYLKTHPPIKDFTLRNYELDLFGVPDKHGSLFNIDILDKYFSYTLLLLYNKFLNKNYYLNEANPYDYDEKFFDLGPNTTLEVYCTNIKYFERYSDQIKKIFDLDKLDDHKHKEIESKIKNSNSVSINIRRGDYLNAKHSSIFVALDENYYKEAIKYIRGKVENPHFFVFSPDDPKWFEETIGMDKSEYTMINEDAKTDLRLISLCKNNIISNSTFAFWGAYLNKNPDKIVVSPKKWMHQYDFEVPSDWIGL